jgi:opacity protein-like surface antigen
MYLSCYKLKRFSVVALAVCSICLSGLHAVACQCSDHKAATEQKVTHKHECTCHKMQQRGLQKVASFFKGAYVRGGLEMRRYTQVARSNNHAGFVWGVGYQIPNEPMRLELLMQYSTVNFKSTTPALHAKARTFFINGYYDFVFEKLKAKRLTPYMMGGVGQTKYRDGSYMGTRQVTSTESQPYLYQNISKTSTAWNAGLGLKFNLSNHIALDAGYRYLVLGKFVKANHIKGHQGLLSAIFIL